MNNQLPINPPNIVLTCPPAKNGLYNCIKENTNIDDIVAIAQDIAVDVAERI